MRAPKARASVWWARGLADGKVCARKRRARFFELYREQAAEALMPGELRGPFDVVYARAFRYGYDAEQEARERRNQYYTRPKKNASVTKKPGE